MKQNIWWKLGFGSILFAGMFISASEVAAQRDGIETEGSIPPGLEQVTNVNQLRDVSPTDWAYEAVRSLVDRFLNGANAPASLPKGTLSQQALCRSWGKPPRPRCIAMAVFQVFPIELIVAIAL